MNDPEDQNKAPRTEILDVQQNIRIVEPWPVLRQLSNDECWERMGDDDLKILGMDRAEWEDLFEGNPCSDPRWTK